LLKEVVAHRAIIKMPAEALDMALDDLVQGGRKTGKGKGKGNAKGGFKSRFQGNKENKGRSKGKRNGDDAKEGKKADAGGDKLEMSLEEVIDKEKGKGKGRKGRNNDEGKGKSRGKGKNWNDDGSYQKGRGKDKGYSSKGYSKGDRWGGGAGKDRGPQVWSEHDDRDGFAGGDDDRSWGKGRDSGKGMGRRPALSGRSGGGMSDPRARVREDRDGWQRVEQSAPIRDTRRDEPPARRRVAASASPPRRREVGGGVKRRGEEPERAPASKRRATGDDSSSKAKSVKVTNIPRDVTMEDIKEAFEAETGRITRCRLDRGTAWIAFTRHEDAKKAIDTFDRGELNGKQIGVVLDA